MYRKVGLLLRVLSLEFRFRKILGKGGLFSAKQRQEYLLLAGVSTASGAVNTEKSLFKRLPVASLPLHSSFSVQ